VLGVIPEFEVKETRSWARRTSLMVNVTNVMTI
jgi:hypothetical protein